MEEQDQEYQSWLFIRNYGHLPWTLKRALYDLRDEPSDSPQYQVAQNLAQACEDLRALETRVTLSIAKVSEATALLSVLCKRALTCATEPPSLEDSVTILSSLTALSSDSMEQLKLARGMGGLRSAE